MVCEFDTPDARFGIVVVKLGSSPGCCLLEMEHDLLTYSRIIHETCVDLICLVMFILFLFFGQLNMGSSFYIHEEGVVVSYSYRGGAVIIIIYIRRTGEAFEISTVNNTKHFIYPKHNPLSMLFVEPDLHCRILFRLLWIIQMVFRPFQPISAIQLSRRRYPLFVFEALRHSFLFEWIFRHYHIVPISLWGSKNTHMHSTKWNNIHRHNRNNTAVAPAISQIVRRNIV